MPQAQCMRCAVCGAESSKYTCPYCTATTCSLPCFQQHKSSAKCAAARASHERRAAIGAPSSLLQRGARDPSRFIAMRDYDHNQMMQDYQFLSQVGRVVSSTGRDLSDARMLPDAGKPGAHARRVPAAQHRREQLGKQIMFRKLPIMLLPDGMSKRQQNKTYWDTKKKSVLYTVQCTFPCVPDTEGVSVHGQPGDADIGVSLRRALGQGDAEQPEAKRRRTDGTSTLGLVPDAYGGLEAASDAMLLLRIYPLRLRNETTTRFLDWWSRKGAALEASGEVAFSAPPARREPLVPQHVLDSVARLHGNEGKTAQTDDALAWAHVALYVSVPAASKIEWLFRSLPPDYGIVEFLELEVWKKEAFAAAERRGKCQLMSLVPARDEVVPSKGKAHKGAEPDAADTPAPADADPAAPAAATKPAAATESAVVPVAPAVPPAAPAVAPAAPAVPPPTPFVPPAPAPSSTASTLVGYASSDSEGEM